MPQPTGPDGRPPATEPTEAPIDPPAAGEPVAPPLEMATVGDRLAAAARRMAAAVHGPQDETAPERAEGVFVCLAPIGEDICGCHTFTRGPVVGLMQSGVEEGVLYVCRGCSARYRFEGAPIPRWTAQL